MSEPTPTETTTRSWPRDLAILLVAAAVGAGIFAIVANRDDGGGGTTIDLPDAVRQSDGGADDEDLQVEAGDGADIVPVDPADAVDPATAVASFLAAEVGKDFEASYALLDDGTQQRAVNPAQWRAEHGQYPPITGFEVLEQVERDGQPAVRTALALASTLDPVIGLVPARAQGFWVVEETADGFRVNFDESAIEPIYPDDAPATDAALAWAEAVQAGDDPGDLQGVGTVAGRLGYVDLVAESTGDFEASEPTLLPPDGGNANVLARFGADVVGWGRLVSLRGPVDVDVVLAPIDDEWRVIGLVDA